MRENLSPASGRACPAARGAGAEAARRIERDILVRNLADGTVLGSCRQLSRQYGVGERAIREAVRIVELRGRARMRRGPGGGLVVAGQELKVVARRVRGNFALIAGDEQSAEAREVVGAVAARLACRRAATAAPALSRWIDEHPLGPERRRERECNAVAFPVALAAASGNIVAELFAAITPIAAVDTPWPVASALATWSRECEQAVLRAVGQGDAEQVIRLMRDYRLRLDRPGSVRRSSPWDDGDVICRTRAGQTARAIIATCLGFQGASPRTEGGALGTIGLLCSDWGISRATAVQALRMLEEAGVITVKAGRGQGYFLKPLSIELIARQIEDYLNDQADAREAACEFMNTLSDGGGTGSALAGQPLAPGDDNKVLWAMLLALKGFSTPEPRRSRAPARPERAASTEP